MDNMHVLKEIVQNQKKGIANGIYSICSANEFVIEAALEKALIAGGNVLIEATANQVNQFGGYTGMTPVDFRDFVFSIAKKLDFPKNRLILGGDHLGPLTWKDEKSTEALGKSCELLAQYILAGFTKIHIDTSMQLADDREDERLSTEVIADRAADLCLSAEKAFKNLSESNPNAMQPVYIIGSEVPIPGGSQEEGLQVTKAEDFIDTVATFERAFKKRKLEDAWKNVIGVVVQPGVEFGDETIHAYNREAAKELCDALKKFPSLIFEGHSTDYQTAAALKQMVEDGIAILKVGPALTFALREALFDLSHIENELFKFSPEIQLSNFINVLDDTMAKKPENWKRHYHGNGGKIRLARKYSLSDRCRYYLPVKEVKEAQERMLKNLESTQIPLTLLSQYMPIQYNKVRNGLLKNEPCALIKDRVVNLLDDYHYATR